jgi:hypothetical protein
VLDQQNIRKKNSLNSGRENMKKIINTRTICSLLIVFLAISLIISCAGKKPPWGDAKTGFILSYNLAKDQVWKYDTKTTQVQTMEMMGNAMETTTNVASIYTITGLGLNEKKQITTQVKMDSASIKAKSPRGEQEIDLSAIVDKDFGLTLGRYGKKVSFSNPNNIEVDMGPGGKRSAEDFFRNVVPRLTPEPVKVGGSWKVTEKDTVNQGGLDIVVDTETTNTIESTETVEGMECLKIASKVSFVLEGSGQQMGADVLFEGDGDGKSTWYYAFKKGAFVKSNTEMLMEGTASVSGGQNMTIPITQETKIEVKLVK